MLQFQSALEALKKDDIGKNAETLSKQVEVLSKQIEMQQGIEDLIIKYREMQHAKYDWLVGAIGGALVTAVVSLFLGARRQGTSSV